MGTMKRDDELSARRTRDVIRVDLSVVRGELKALYLFARASGTQHDAQVTRRALDALDKVIRELDDPALLHPTLF
jgi:hypothetical protein